MAQTRVRIGDRLLEKGVLDQRKLEVAIKEQRRAHRPLGEILVSLGFASEEDVAGLLAEDLGLDLVPASAIEGDGELLDRIDAGFARRTQSFPIALEDGVLRVGCVDPDDPALISEIRQRFPFPLILAVLTESDLRGLISKYLPEKEARVQTILDSLSTEQFGDEFPVERVTQAILLDAIHRGATDIHVEPEERITRVRYRIDGILQQAENLPRAATDAVISRLKILSNLDISERRRPQDGRLRMVVNQGNVDMRVSIMPTADGENVVLRILDTSGGVKRLNQLGMEPEKRLPLLKITERSHGLFLVTGPTGSGKTTTLYALLAEVDAVHRSVATVEDPVEYRLPLLRQSQVEPGIGYTFLQGLRALLRQDPDVILVGEIRDHETASMAIKASMTGHLVFSTLHTNSALGAIPRLTDLGIEPYLVEDALIGVLAQRLVRRICSTCAEPVEPTPHELEFLLGDPGQMKKGKGCQHCGDSGYRGRAALSELFLPDESMAEVLRQGADLVELRRLAEASGFKDMNYDGRLKVQAGITTVEEVERVNRSHRLSKKERENL
ncbi:MAG: type II/IV secretion system protein [Planctomycetota bacterium]|nr:MAG: type II/IV secretion system protein [Planctomycetota bacterium]